MGCRLLVTASTQVEGLNMPLEVATCLDLPLKVVNSRKAIDLLGGPEEISRVTVGATLSKTPEKLELRLRDNRFHHPVTSSVIPSRNLIIELTIPASTSNALKNDTTGLHTSDDDVRSSLAQAAHHGLPVKITPKYVTETTYRFRELADFQYYTGDSSFIQRADHSLFNYDLSEMEKLSFAGGRDGITKGKAPSDGILDLIPPPRFSTVSQPFYYGYKQNNHLKIVKDESGNRQIVNTIGSVRVISNILNWGDEIPSNPPVGLEQSPRPAIMRCIARLKELFATRPSYTRRSLQHSLEPVLAKQLKFALPYVSFYYRSGPWRGSYIKYGCDPARDRGLAIYQVEHFRITGTSDMIDEDPESLTSGSAVSDLSTDPRIQHWGRNSDSYLYDGTKFPDVPLLQLSDIADGFLEQFINDRSQLREQVDNNDGWYLDHQISIIRRVLRAELVVLKEGKQPLSYSEKQQIKDEQSKDYR